MKNGTSSHNEGNGVRARQYTICTGYISATISDMTPLHEAAYNGEIDSALKLLRSGSDINARTQNGKWTPLHMAVEEYKKEMVEFLLTQGANPDMKDESGETPLHLAADNDDIECVKMLIQHHANVNARDRCQSAPLLSSHKLEVIDCLISAGADINTRAEDGNTALYFAACRGDREIFDYLISRGADIEIININGKSALHGAVEKGHCYETGILLAHGLNINKGDNSGSTPLHHAVKAGNSYMAEFLISRGAWVDSEDEHGKTPLFLARDPGMADYLIGKGADITKRDRQGLTLLHQSILNSWGMDESGTLIAYYLKKGIQINSADNDGMTPLHHAAELGFDTMVEVLIKHGATVDIKDRMSRTPLHMAAACRFSWRNSGKSLPEIIQTLISKGAKINGKDEEGATPVDYAIWNDDKNIEKILRAYGGKTSISIPDTIVQILKEKDLETIERMLDSKKWLVNAKGEGSQTLLHYAALCRDEKIVKMLIQKGADVNAHTAELNNDSPLHHAVYHNNIETCRILIQNGADINAMSYNGTPLFCSQTPEMARFLISAGADVNQKDMDGQTFLHFLSFRASVYCGEVEKHRREIAEVLLSSGADINALDSMRRTPLDLAAGSLFDIMKVFLEEHGALRSNEKQ
ncbi:MAG: ankyrin repeat domain-containing protein [Vulcanimicrobiota bacterium]